MPAVSVMQSRALNAKMGHAWVVAHHFDNSTKGLPMRVRRRKPRNDAVTQALMRGSR